MTKDQYKAALKRLGMTQAQAAVFTGYSLRSSQGFALGEYPVPVAVAKLLRNMLRHGDRPEDVK